VNIDQNTTVVMMFVLVGMLCERTVAVSLQC